MENEKTVKGETQAPAPTTPASPNNLEERRNLAKVLLGNNTPLETILAQSGLSKEAVFGIKGSMVKQAKRLETTEADSKPQIEIQAKNHSDSEFLRGQPLEGGQRSNESMVHSLPPSSPLPSNGVILDRTATDAVESLLPKTAIATYRQILSNAEEKQKLEGEKQRLQGHVAIPTGDNSGSKSVDDLNRQILEQKLRVKKAYADFIEESLEQAQVTGMLEQIRSPQKATTTASEKTLSQQLIDGLKMGIDLAKGGNGNVDVLKVYRQGKEDENHTYQNAIRTGETNVEDLKLEEMRQMGQIENRKLDWEKEKWQNDKDSTGKTIDTIKELVQPLIGKGIEIVGAVAQKKLNVGTKQPNVACPQCTKPFYADPAKDIITCPSCGVKLSKNPLPEQPAEPTEQPTTEKAEPAETKVPKQSLGFEPGEF